MTARVEVICDARHVCGEAPTWDAALGRLLWTDNETAFAYTLDEAGRRVVLTDQGPVLGIVVNRGGGYVFSGPGGIRLWRKDGEERVIAAQHAGRALALNDIAADARGRVYGGTLYWDESGMREPGTLYVIDTDGSVRILDQGMSISNGVDFSPDDATLYFADSGARRVYAYAFDLERGSVGERRTLVDIDPSQGIPDGIVVDDEGFIWVAMWYGGQLLRFDPDGALARRVPLPVRQVSSLIFGGPNLDQLYVTTAGEPWSGPLMPPGYDPDADDIGGPLYRVHPGVPGRAKHQADFDWLNE